MNDVIGGILAFAIAIAISPPPIIAVVLFLLSPKAKRSSVAFLFGWVAGILLAVTVMTVLSSFIPAADENASQPILGTLRLVLGTAVILLAVRYVRARPKVGEIAEPPRWMSSIDGMSGAGAVGFGFLFAALNPKNLLLAMNAGLVIGVAQLEVGQVAGVLAIFTLIAASTVLIPVVAYLVASEKLAAPLTVLQGWLVPNSWLIMSLLLLIIGVLVIGNGIASF